MKLAKHQQVYKLPGGNANTQIPRPESSLRVSISYKLMLLRLEYPGNRRKQSGQDTEGIKQYVSVYCCKMIIITKPFQDFHVNNIKSNQEKL